MRAYDCNKPLIHIHIPKTGGTSIKEIYKKWFNNGLLFHYKSAQDGSIPKKHDLETLQTPNTAICIYGHFNKKQNFGIQDYYPEVKQFITILRDPFEKAVSGYFFLRKQSANWKDQSNIPKGELGDYLLNNNDKAGMFNHFPSEVTLENFREVIETQFIEIGVLEHLDESMMRIASKLNYKFNPSSIQKLNVTERDQRIPYELKQEFIEMNPLAYAVYDYVLSKYT